MFIRAGLRVKGVNFKGVSAIPSPSFSFSLSRAASSSTSSSSGLFSPPNSPCSPSSPAPFSSSFRRFVHVSSDEELSFTMITPKSLAKGHVGGIVARLLSTPGIRIVGARMYEPSEEMKDDLYRATQEAIVGQGGELIPYHESILQFIEGNLTEQACSAMGIENRVLLLLFAGRDTRKKLAKIVGDNIPPPEEYGRTIRGTYGDYTRLLTGEVLTFEPAVLIPHSELLNTKKLEVFAKYADIDGGVMKQKRSTYRGMPLETGMVMIKPDNFLRPSALPGHILDLFGTTGLKIVGTKVLSMSLGQAKEFYGFLEDVFVKKLRSRVEETLRKHLENAFEFKLSDEHFQKMTEVINRDHAREELIKVITYMTGIEPDLHKYTEKRHLNEPGMATCFAVLYRGPKAIEVIRNKLGSTDPTKAEAGTIRSDYGHDLMRNGAHASDTPESVERERKIIGLHDGQPSTEKHLIENWLNATRK